jgi:DNA-binding transcriptional regulator YhcF (GntR family)
VSPNDRTIEIDPASPMPIYHQIEKALERQIEADLWEEGEQLPSERELAEQLSVSRMTVREAVRSLVLAGYCYRARGRGIFVRRRVFINTQRFEGFTASMRQARTLVSGPSRRSLVPLCATRRALGATRRVDTVTGAANASGAGDRRGSRCPRAQACPAASTPLPVGRRTP